MNETKPRGRFAVWLATGLGVGLVSPAPGTIGGLWGLPLAWLIMQLSPLGAQIAAIVLIGIVGVAICGQAANVLGDSKDPQSIVFDEIAALPIVFLGVATTGPGVWVVGWLLFRLFDITKPPPTKWFEKLPGGLGIMADDWVAAIEACVSLHILIALDTWLAWGAFSS